MSVLRESAHLLGRIQGRRKVLLYVGDGIDYDLTPAIAVNGLPWGVDPLVPSNEGGDVSDGIARFIDAASRANVVVYTVDPR